MLIVAVGIAVISGALTALQTRVNSQLSLELGDGILASVISFASGLVILTIAVLVAPRGRDGLARLTTSVRERRTPWWYLIGGLFGAVFVVGQGLTAAVLGVALFTIAAVATQTITGAVIDRVGLGDLPKRPVTALRVVASLLALAAVTFSGQAGPSARVEFTAVKPVLGPIPPKPDVTLSSLKPLEARTGWGKLTAAKSITGRPLQLGKTTYADGIGLHAPARAVYQRQAEWKRFVAVVGINESQRPADQSSLICRVAVATADGEKVLASSPTLRFGRMEKWHFDVALPDQATRVILLVDQADNADKSDHADWCDAGFLK